MKKQTFGFGQLKVFVFKTAGVFHNKNICRIFDTEQKQEEL